ncbi:unnamed protein product [Dovyalis caffra]|uniref:Uncharacterized protein n=1 Tax=Dovyalis caffra TaxID=77055 RepID=A0AAV1SAI0_9ROSI|nr:unnamed protein product [Dovyalis caffra]
MNHIFWNTVHYIIKSSFLIRTSKRSTLHSFGSWETSESVRLSDGRHLTRDLITKRSRSPNFRTTCGLDVGSLFKLYHAMNRDSLLLEYYCEKHQIICCKLMVGSKIVPARQVAASHRTKVHVMDGSIAPEGHANLQVVEEDLRDSNNKGSKLTTASYKVKKRSYKNLIFVRAIIVEGRLCRRCDLRSDVRWAGFMKGRLGQIMGSHFGPNCNESKPINPYGGSCLEPVPRENRIVSQNKALLISLFLALKFFALEKEP